MKTSLRIVYLSSLIAGSVALIMVPLKANAEDLEPGTFTFSTETKRPDMTREARDTAPKYNPTSHVRTTTKEEAGN
jgi:hypothetical protein